MSKTNGLIAGGVVLLLGGCAGGAAVRDVPVRIGPPYQVRGVTYVPAADPSFDMLGYASWYGSEAGDRTASGERFRTRWITAAHPTLPLPTYAEVTSLDSGRRIVVRINDRGPFAGGARIIDRSRGAAEALGFRERGSAAVRVRRIEPLEADRQRLRKGKAARPLPPASARVLQNLRSQLSAGRMP